MSKLSARLGNHPVVITGLFASLLVTIASFLLCAVEPTAFPTFWDAAWYSVTTITTIGYGDIVPHTPWGRGISVFLILSGISLAGVFIGLVSEIVREWLLKANHVSMMDLAEALAENKKLLGELLAERKEQNALLQQLLEERKANSNKPPGQS
jgi:voltage-gated potassium channel